MKTIFKKIFLALTNGLAQKNQEITRFFLLREIEEKWEKAFKGLEEINYRLEKDIQIKLQRHSKFSEYLLFHDFEKIELDLISKFIQKGDYVLDIGANIGLHSLYASVATGNAGQVFSFEPTTSTYARLNENINLNSFQNISAWQIGLSDKADKLMLQTSTQYDAWNSFAKNGTSSSVSFDKEVEVDVISLDNWIIENIDEPNRISFIKIDVEGWEKYVVNGALKFLEEFAPLLLVEFDDENTHRADYSAVEVYDILVGKGYTLYNIVDKHWAVAKRKLSYSSQNLVALKTNSIFGRRFQKLF